MTTHWFRPILAMICLSMNAFVFAADPPQSEMTAPIKLDGIDISLSKPRLVARSSGYLWFPTMTRLSDEELFANFSTNRDEVVADRIPNGWNAIPPGSKDTNSIWVVKISWEER